MRCSDCGHWTTERAVVYEDGSRIVNYTAPSGRGHCDVLDLDTAPEFGCTSFVAGGHVRETSKTGASWHHFVMVRCPQCAGNPGGGSCQCAGTGLVRLYDDGHLGDEKTRKHPKECESGTAPPVDPGTLLVPVVVKADPVDAGGAL